MSNYPKEPGVYWFLDKNNKTLYVGKAKNLKNRITSYKHISGKSLKTKEMLKKAKTIKHQTTESELEALILEAELIKTYQPYYNSQLKDDKSPLYINITKDKYPKVRVKRSGQFGPYPSGYKAKQVLKFLRRIFPFCNASNSDQAKNKACFYSHLNLCPGACTNKISPEEYQENIKNIKLFLKNKKRSILKNLYKEIKVLSEKKDFEKALKLRNQLLVLESLSQSPLNPDLDLPLLEDDIQNQKLLNLLRILRKHLSLPSRYPLNHIEAYDISNLEGKHATASMVVFKDAKPSKSDYRIFKIKSLKTPNDPQMLHEALLRRSKHLEWGIPNLIVIDGGTTQLKASIKAIPWNIPIVSIAKNPDRLILNPSTTNFTKVTLNPKNSATKLLQHLRDESHRFAKNYHKKLRQKHLQG